MKKNKIAMYGEMPTIKIGKYIIAKWNDDKKDNSLYIGIEEGAYTGEGMQLNHPEGIQEMENAIEKIYNKYF